MAGSKKGTEYVCEVCGTRLLLMEGGEGWVEDLVCCEVPMTAKAPKKSKAKPKRKTKAKKRR